MTVKKLVFAIFLVGAISTMSQANVMVAADNSNFTQLCMTALAGNRAAMHNHIKSLGYSKPFIVNNVQCNGVNILAFVQQHGKNSAAMLRIVDRSGHRASIKDITKK
ncbi:MAG: cytolysin (calcineurin-like family phosphatase) [Cognaticolwellia sp.]|jgi:cytolysin (calcineurin-like family phosphatase)